MANSRDFVINFLACLADIWALTIYTCKYYSRTEGQKATMPHSREISNKLPDLFSRFLGIKQKALVNAIPRIKNLRDVILQFADGRGWTVFLKMHRVFAICDDSNCYLSSACPYWGTSIHNDK